MELLSCLSALTAVHQMLQVHAHGCMLAGGARGCRWGSCEVCLTLLADP